jgi:energy-coupling factor transporter ATP-binding protein EcfA2
MNGVEIEIKKHFGEVAEIGVDEWCDEMRRWGRLWIRFGEEKSDLGCFRIDELNDLLKREIQGFFHNARFYLFNAIEGVKNGVMVFKEKGEVIGVWIDIDRDISDVKRIYEKLPEATFLIFTGRFWALLWLLEDGFYEKGKRDDFEELKNLMLQVIDDDEIKKEMKAKHITNAMVRVINTENTKTGKMVRWFRIGEGKIWKVEDLKKELIERGAVLGRQEEQVERQRQEQEKTSISISISTTKKIPDCLNHCGLAKFLWSNFDDGIKYEGWRLLSYFAVLNKEFRGEFEKRSREWEEMYPERAEQTTEKRLKISEKDLQRGGGFFYCSTISGIPVEDLRIFHSRLDFHPCSECPFRNYNRRPFELFSIPEGYELKGNVLYKGSREIAVNFDLNKIEKIVISDDYENMWIFVRDDDGVKELNFEKENALRLFFGVLGNIQVFKDFLIKFIKENEHIIYKKPSFSGYNDGVWKILWRDYFTAVVSDNFDLSQRGDVEKWKSEWFNICDFVIREKDVITALLVGNALRFLKRDYWGFAPAIVLLGDRGSGKTIRLKMINSLIRKPSVVDYYQMTPAFLLNNIGKIRGFITIDEFLTSGQEDERTLALLGLLNISGKFTARAKYPENYNTILMAGEETSFRFWGKQGLNRRVLRLILKKDDEGKWKRCVEFYREAIQNLEENYGFLYTISDKILEVEKKIGFLNLDLKVEEIEHRDIIEKALRMFFSFCVVLGACKLEDVYGLIEEFASLSVETQEKAYETAILQSIIKILDVLNKMFEQEKRKKVYLDEVLQRVPSAIPYKDEISLIFCDGWSKNEYEKNGKMYKHIKTFSISRNTPIFQSYKNERFWTSSEFMNYIREKRERMKREYGRDIWEKITDEKIYQIVQGFLSDDVLQNENGNLKSGENGGANKMENKFKIKDDTVFQNYERYDDDETIYFDDSG